MRKAVGAGFVKWSGEQYQYETQKRSSVGLSDTHSACRKMTKMVAERPGSPICRPKTSVRLKIIGRGRRLTKRARQDPTLEKDTARQAPFPMGMDGRGPRNPWWLVNSAKYETGDPLAR